MAFIKRHWLLSVAGALMFVTAVAIVGFGVYLASTTGSLPWQADPTRIAITPFADIQGFSAPTATSVPAIPVTSTP
jgi:hypothetical protein